jgi:hypothetical protein
MTLHAGNFIKIVMSNFVRMVVFTLNYAISASDNLEFPGYDYYFSPPVIPYIEEEFQFYM